MNLAEAEGHFLQMLKARRECIEIWNREIRAARRDIERLRNQIRMGSIQPDLLDMMRGNRQAGKHKGEP